jgi:hypothetical protein
MGSEVILPGTPLNQIPAGDRPIFDPSLQNGYAGLAGGGASVNGQTPIGVTKEVNYLNYAPAAFGAPADSGAKFASINITSGDSEYLIGYLYGGSGSGPNRLGTLIIAAPGAVTTGEVLLDQNGGNGVIDVTHAPSGQLVIPNFRFDATAGGGVILHNSDAATQNVRLAFFPNDHSLDDGQAASVVYDFATGSGPQFALGPNDIMRVRELSLLVFPSSAPTGQYLSFDGDAQLVIENSPPITPGWSVRMNVVTSRVLKGHRYRGGWPSPDTYGGSGPIVYSLDAPITIAGADGVIGGHLNAGSNWSPRIWATFFYSGSNGSQPVLRGIFEVFRNANA